MTFVKLCSEFPVGPAREQFLKKLVEIPKSVLELLCSNQAIKEVKTTVDIKDANLFSDLGCVVSKKELDLLYRLYPNGLQLIFEVDILTYDRFDVLKSQPEERITNIVSLLEKVTANEMESLLSFLDASIYSTLLKVLFDLPKLNLKHLYHEHMAWLHNNENRSAVRGLIKKSPTNLKAWLELAKYKEWVLKNNKLCMALKSVPEKDRVWFWKYQLSDKVLTDYRELLPLIREMHIFMTSGSRKLPDGVVSLILRNEVTSKGKFETILFLDPDLPLNIITQYHDYVYLIGRYLTNPKALEVIVTTVKASKKPVPYDEHNMKYLVHNKHINLALMLFKLVPSDRLPYASTRFGHLASKEESVEIVRYLLSQSDQKLYLANGYIVGAKPSFSKLILYALAEVCAYTITDIYQLSAEYLALRSESNKALCHCLWYECKKEHRPDRMLCEVKCVDFECNKVHPDTRRPRCAKVNCMEFKCKYLHHQDRELCTEKCFDIGCDKVHPSHRAKVCDRPDTCYIFNCGMLHSEYRKKICLVDRNGKCNDWDCVDLHRRPNCKLGEFCLGHDCWKRHPRGRKFCRKRICNDRDCKYIHKTNRPNGTRMCRWGLRCRRKNCIFRHPKRNNSQYY